MSKYDPLRHHLVAARSGELPMSFADIEALLGFSLPRSARAYAPWWANETRGGHVQAGAWLRAGWRTTRVDVAGERVVFVRAPAGMAEDGATYVTAPPRPLTPRGLSAAAERLLADYTAEAGGDAEAAVARALHEAAIARRARMIDEIALSGAKSKVDSVDLIREDRDGR
jgi:hypothetical protein